MAIDTSVPRSRRALLAGGVGGLAAIVAAIIGRPLPARAGTDGDVVLGAANTSHTTTRITNLVDDSPVFWASSDKGRALVGTSLWSQGVYGSSSSGFGVHGESGLNAGVHGRSATGWGVLGEGPSGIGVHGRSADGLGVAGESTTHYGVAGDSHAADRAGVLGRGFKDGTGVIGASGGIVGWVIGRPKTGVYGEAAQDPAARGVWGYSPLGQGVRGQATGGTGVYATSQTGYALRTSGRIRVDRVAGVASIAAAKDRVEVTPGVAVTAGSFVLLTPRGDLGTRRLWYTTDPSADTFTIRVSSALTRDLRVGWLLLG